MSEKVFKRIAIREITEKVHRNSITEIEGLAVSRKSSFSDEFMIDFQFPYMLDGFIVIFCSRGTCKVRVNINEFEIREQTVLVASPGFILQLLEHSDDSEIDYILFTFDFISDIRLHTHLSDVAKAVERHSILLPGAEDFNDLLGLKQLMVKQFEQKDILREYVIKSLLYSIIYKILQLYSLDSSKDQRKLQNREDVIYYQFISLLFEHYKQERSVGFYAEKLHLTPKYFSKMIGKVDGLSATQWIDEMVIVGAKALLKSSSLSIAQISEELNFANPSFFGTYFKKKVGMTPLEYRNK